MTDIDLDMTRGDSAEWTSIYTESGTPTDITGAKLWMTAVRGDGGPVIFSVTSDPGGGITIDADQFANPGKSKIKLVSENTSGLSSEIVRLKYDVQILINGDIHTISSGTLTVSPDYTTAIA